MKRLWSGARAFCEEVSLEAATTGSAELDDIDIDVPWETITGQSTFYSRPAGRRAIDRLVEGRHPRDPSRIACGRTPGNWG